MNSFPEECVCTNDCRRKLGARCDYALIVDNSILYLIELKGRNLKHACEQLLATFSCFKTNYPMEKYNCRAVVSKVVAPNKPSPAEKRLIRLQAAGAITYGKREIKYEEIL